MQYLDNVKQFLLFECTYEKVVKGRKNIIEIHAEDDENQEWKKLIEWFIKGKQTEGFL